MKVSQTKALFPLFFAKLLKIRFPHPVFNLQATDMLNAKSTETEQ